MNGNSDGILPGVTTPTHEVLALVFNTPARKKRLRQVLGCKMGEVYKKLAGERGNPLHASVNILQLAVTLDREERTTLSRLIADILPVVHRHLAETTPEESARDWRREANELMREGAEAACTINLLDSDERDLPDLAAAIRESAQLEERARGVRRALEARVRIITNRVASPQKRRAATTRSSSRPTNRQPKCANR